MALPETSQEPGWGWWGLQPIQPVLRQALGLPERLRREEPQLQAGRSPEALLSLRPQPVCVPELP